MRSYLLVFILFLSLSAEAQDKTLLVLGDSISAGYGITLNQGWVHLLQKRLTHLGYRYKVINASISGDTTRGARARLDKLLARHQPDISIIELGGNDGLRGLSLEEISKNLDNIIGQLKNIRSRILLIPMRLPPNYGQVYNDRFAAVYEDLASEHNILSTAFIMQDIADKAELMQADGIHPLAEAQPLMLDIVWEKLKSQLEKD